MVLGSILFAHLGQIIDPHYRRTAPQHYSSTGHHRNLPGRANIDRFLMLYLQIGLVLPGGSPIICIIQHMLHHAYSCTMQILHSLSRRQVRNQMIYIIYVIQSMSYLSEDLYDLHCVIQTMIYLSEDLQDLYDLHCVIQSMIYLSEVWPVPRVLTRVYDPKYLIT